MQKVYIPPALRRIYFKECAVGMRLRVGKRYYIPGKYGPLLCVCTGYKLITNRKYPESEYFFASETGQECTISNYNPWIQAVHHRREVCEKNAEILLREIRRYHSRRAALRKAFRLTFRQRVALVRNRFRKEFRRLRLRMISRLHIGIATELMTRK